MLNFLKTLFKHYKKLIRFIYEKKVMSECKTFTPPLFVGGYSNATRNTVLGKNVNFNGMRIKGNGFISIGNNFHSGEGCLMITSFHNYDQGTKIPYDSTNIDKDIIIEDNVWLGDRVILLGGISIGEGAIIQAGSVVISDIPKYAIVGGHPARIFSQRNIEHYEKLKKEKKFQ